MSKHLNADQMAEWMAGERRPELEGHLRECAGCRLALEEMQTALGGWRHAVRGWSDREYQLAQQRVSDGLWDGGKRSVWRWATMRLYWAGGATAACALAAVLAWYGGGGSVTHSNVPSSGPASTAGTNTARWTNPDAALMRQVDREVSQTVPDAMTPLMGLVSWDADEGTRDGTADGKQNSKQVE